MNEVAYWSPIVRLSGIDLNRSADLLERRINAAGKTFDETGAAR